MRGSAEASEYHPDPPSTTVGARGVDSREACGDPTTAVAGTRPLSGTLHIGERGLAITRVQSVCP